MSNQSPDLSYVLPTYATEERAQAARLAAMEALKDFVRALARADFERDWKELMETGRCRTMSLDPNVDWKQHEAEWAAFDAAQEQLAQRKRKRTKGA